MWKLPLLVVAGMAFASGASAQSLESALAAAYNSNPELSAQRAAARVADEGIQIALSGYRPRITAQGSFGAQVSSSTANVGGGQSTSSGSSFPAGVGLELSQNIFDGYQTANTVRQAETNVEASRATLRNVEQNVLLDAVAAYMNVLRDAAVLNLQRNNVDVLVEQLRQTEVSLEAGVVTRTDVEQARARLAQARSQSLAAEATLKASKAVYRQVIGSTPKKLQPAKPLRRLLPKSLEAAISEAMETHPAIVGARFGVDAASLQVRIIEGQFAPSVNLNAGVQHNINPSSNVDNQTSAQITARLSVPLYEGGLVSGRTRQAKEQLAQVRLQADVAREQVRAAVVTAWGNLDAATAQIEAADAVIQAAEAALAGVRAEAKEGQRTTLEVLNAQQDLLNARVQLVRAQRDRVVASYAVASASGRLSARRLGLKVKLYDPSENTRIVRERPFGVGTDTASGQ